MSTQARPYRTQFQADNAGTDNAQALRHGLEFQGAGGVDDDFLVDRSWRDVDRARTGCQDHVFGFDHFDSAVRLGDFDFLAGQQLAVALDRSDAVGLEQGGDAAGQVFHDVGLATDHGRYIHGHACVADTVDFEAVFGFVEFPGAVQQRLGRNATDVQAGTAQGQLALSIGVFLDASGRQTELSCLDSCYIAARARTDHYYVKFLRHSKDPL
ncbi:hypothetical protein D3C84_443680 [compost metagenome]